MPDKQYGSLDVFKLIAAFLVVAIHISPLSSLSAEADFLLTRVFARIAVPFFLMVSGFFLLPRYLLKQNSDHRALLRFLGKAALLYLIASAIYLPINIYAGQFEDFGILSLLRMILFDGTFYHLWYLPATMTGILLLYLLGRKLPFVWLLFSSFLLYVIGLFGDSYYGVISNAPVISSLYDAGFHLFSYTRNGLFYTPIFLTMGAWFAASPRLCTKRRSILGFSLCMILMAFEGLALHHFGFQRHDSMYLALLPCMYFLFQLVLSLDLASGKRLRTLSIWIYLIHPFSLVFVRGVAKYLHLTDVLVENSLILYLSVCALSFLFSLCITLLPFFNSKKHFHTGRAWIELDRTALRHNVEALCALLPQGCCLMPAVKANAYGHGASLVAKELRTMGIKAFCVASVLEAVELRRNGIRGEILILGYTNPEQFHLLSRYHLTQTVIDHAYAQVLSAYGKKVKVHVGIDTGMHRLGERCERIDEIEQIFRCKNLKIEGVFTHLCADETKTPEDTAFTLTQGQAFREVLAELRKRGYTCPKIHMQASYGLLNYPELSGDYARVGIALYGLLSTSADTEQCAVSLKPVLSLKARISCIKELYQGESAGYGLQFIAKEDLKIATISIGYADGLPRSLSCGVGTVLIHGFKAPIIGRICMDQTLIDVSNIPDVQAGDIAVIIGRSETAELTACDLAQKSGTISNEILSRLGQRLERTVVS